MMPPETYVERLAKLWDKSWCSPAGSEVQACLKSDSQIEDIEGLQKVWKTWRDRNTAVWFGAYSRYRDRTRAYKRNDFRLARALDE